MKKNVFQVLEEIYTPGIKLTVAVNRGMVYLEGTKKSLKWLATIIAAYADQNHVDDFWIKPKGPGAVYFSDKATHGLYLYRQPHKNRKKKTR